MDATNAKTEILNNHFQHSLQQLVSHYAEAGDSEALMDIRRAAEASVDAAIARIGAGRRLE